MPNLILDSIKFLYHEYSDTQRKAAMATHLRESILREISMNLEIIKEAKALHKDQPEKSKSLVAFTEIDAFKAVEATGVPMQEIFGKQSWSNRGAYTKPFQNLRYTQYTDKIGTVAELIERAYHRIRIHQLRSELNIHKRQQSVNYLEALLLECKEAIKNTNQRAD